MKRMPSTAQCTAFLLCLSVSSFAFVSLVQYVVLSTYDTPVSPPQRNPILVPPSSPQPVRSLPASSLEPQAADPSFRRYTDLSAQYPLDHTRRAYRRQAIVEAIAHSFDGYVTCAGMKNDELRPVSCSAKNWEDGVAPGEGGREGPGISVTLLDSLGTLWLANLTDRYNAALTYIRDSLSFDVPMTISHFEATIRLVGGLLSAFELSGEKHAFLLSKAKDLADRLLEAYNTSSGIPDIYVHLQLGNHSNPLWRRTSAVLSELGTSALEFRTLSYHTKDNKYADAVNRVNGVVAGIAPPNALCSVFLDTNQMAFTGEHVTLGAMGDSYYEYLLKQYVHSGHEDLPALARFLRVASSVGKDMMWEFEIEGEPRAFVCELRNREDIPIMDHLACFVGGWFALAYEHVPWEDAALMREVARVHNIDLSSMKDKVWKLAHGVTRTCVDAYHLKDSSLGPELFALRWRDFSTMRVHHRFQPYLLRPELLESIYLLWRAHKTYEAKQGSGKAALHGTTSRDWEERAWDVFVAVQSSCLTKHGYSGVVDVSAPTPSDVKLTDHMPSYWIAETLKYLLLIFSDEPEERCPPSPSPCLLAPGTSLDLSGSWVLNTEAHPLRIRADLFTRVPAL